MRYFLTEEKEVTKEEYINAERQAGFFTKNTEGEDTICATASFNNGKIKGRVQYEEGDIND